MKKPPRSFKSTVVLFMENGIFDQSGKSKKRKSRKFYLCATQVYISNFIDKYINDQRKPIKSVRHLMSKKINRVYKKSVMLRLIVCKGCLEKIAYSDNTANCLVLHVFL